MAWLFDPMDCEHAISALLSQNMRLNDRFYEDSFVKPSLISVAKKRSLHH